MSAIVGKVATCTACQSLVSEPDALFCPNCGRPLRAVPGTVTAGHCLAIDCGSVMLCDVVGQGGMGIVRRGELHYAHGPADRPLPSHPVAVKLLSPMMSGHTSAEQLFQDEAEALSRLAHPNIVHFFGLARFEGHIAIVMEYVQGKPLSELLLEAKRGHSDGRLPVIPMVPAWNVFSQLLGALASIHALGIVHRDVKPSNILVRTDGLVKLTDFGIAQLPRARPVGVATAAGTGAYMSPEQVTAAPVDARSDLYAAAIVLFELLAGVTPFESPERSELQVRVAQVNEVPCAISSLLTNAPSVLDVFFARALAKDARLRFASAIEMGEALRTGLGLPDTSGWAAERRLAAHAVAISRQQSKSPEPTLSEAVANELRTGVMAAYQS